MSVAAAVQFTQGVNVGPAGQALFGVTGTSVSAANGDNTGVKSWAFTMVDVPPTSAVATGLVQSGSGPTYSFDPDVSGGYLMSITVTGYDGSTATDTRCFGVKRPSGLFVPPFTATAPMLNFGGQARGWAAYMDTLVAWLAILDSPALYVSGATALDNTVPANFWQGKRIMADNRSAAFTVTLPPASQLFDQAVVGPFVDRYGQWAPGGSNNLTLSCSSGYQIQSPIAGASPGSSFTLAVPRASQAWVYDSGQRLLLPV